MIMKCFKFIFLSILLISVSTTQSYTQESLRKLPVAYIDMDTLLFYSEYSKNLNIKLKQQTEKFENLLTDKKEKFESEAEKFKQKLNNNEFFSAEAATKEYERIKKMESDIDKYSEKLKSDLLEEQVSLNKSLEETIRRCLKEYNKDKRYHLIYTNSGGLGNIVYAHDEYNITNDFLRFLNAGYETKYKE